ncbi:MAG: hypothetical protein KDB27_35900, partial [Planctomycetales bacterium]|nr:hypothetical protein [Planctomycetales bacterium]
DRFEIRRRGRKTVIPWLDCSEFRRTKICFVPLVVYSRYDDAEKASVNWKLRFVGATRILPDNYGTDVGELADLMNAYRSQSLNATATA